MIKQRAFKYRLKPTRQNRELFLMFAGARRWTFNHGLELRQKVYQTEGRTISYYEQNNELTTLKDLPETLWLQEIHSQIPQQALKDLDYAYQHFFRRLKNGEKPGHPKFKKKASKKASVIPKESKLKALKPIFQKSAGSSFINQESFKAGLKKPLLFKKAMLGISFFLVR